MRIDLNSDLGESYGPWRMGDDEGVLSVVTSANIACGGHAGDPSTMVETLALARAKGVVAGAHPGFADREGFGRRLIPLTTTEVERLVATQVGALMGAAALAGVRVRYVKPHGALCNWAADERPVADAIARAIKAVSPGLALLAISGTELEAAGNAAGLATFSEIFADRGYLASGRLVPRSRPGAMIEDPALAAARLVDFLSSGLMPTLDGGAIRLAAHSVCVHGDSPGALAMARQVRAGLEAAGVAIAAFLPPEGGIAGLPPEGGIAGLPPEGGVAGLPPEGGVAGLPPGGGIAGLPPEGGIAGLPPEGGVAGLPPGGGVAGLPPEGKAAGGAAR